MVSVAQSRFRSCSWRPLARFGLCRAQHAMELVVKEHTEHRKLSQSSSVLRAAKVPSSGHSTASQSQEQGRQPGRRQQEFCS